jgi:hypothetical protein
MKDQMTEIYNDGISKGLELKKHVPKINLIKKKIDL